MGRRKKRLTSAQRAERDRRRREFMWVFMNGKQVRVRRPHLIDGLTVEEFVRRNTDPLWLHQHELWELMPVERGGEPADMEVDEADAHLLVEPQGVPAPVSTVAEIVGGTPGTHGRRQA